MTTGLPIDAEKPIVGMVHLPPLPGAPKYSGDFEAVRESALRDARRLEAGGADALLLENFGDAPFYPDDVPKHVVASMTRVAAEIRGEVDLPMGVNVLRNDAAAALSVAAAVGAAFVRVNVHSGARVTDQGVVEGRAHETVRLRERLDSDAAVLADLDVKHSAPLAERPIDAEAVAEPVERGLAEGIVVSGAGTGHEVGVDRLRAVASARDEAGLDAPILLGSGVTAANAADLLSVADGAIVGTALKEGGETTNPVSVERVERVVEAVEEVR
ncbi:BtpA/SgcQ family protein [Halorussus gelatinilyticus]|uniref:BtpA/SgcQ family protein n=1 Tax=Halorussus gelatinilyticus TaxID=2937524 RepID=A0A8U0IN29_9EURY|nr:BtpA/SgcQ family protein [Halorussus gelatinilyticus]UPW02148.1 BtpA/SgcQ family protein [Halorussus gelatinilyticus]